MLQIHELKIDIDQKEDALEAALCRKLGLRQGSVKEWKILRESLDARDKNDLKRTYALAFALGDPAQEEALLRKKGKLRLESYAPPAPYDFCEKIRAQGLSPEGPRPVVVGFGPCGMFAALILAEAGLRPVVLERGRAVEDRIVDVERFWTEGILDPESNVQFGEGGAGTFSDGKLTTRIRDPRITKVIAEMVAAGAPADIAYKQKAHIGTDVLRTMVTGIREKICSLGGEVRFSARLTGLVTDPKSGHITGVRIHEEETLETDTVILAIGHSARDTFRMLSQSGLKMEAKPFSMGVRIEHPQKVVTMAQYGPSGGELTGPADYQLSCRTPEDRGVYTFCMCPGGHVVAAASQEGGVVTNGMSYRARDGENANSALLVDVRVSDFPGEHPLAGVELQEKYERLAFLAGGGDYKAPAQRVGEFLGEEKAPGQGLSPTYRPGVVWTDIAKCLPDFITESLRYALPVLGRKLKGFDHPDAILTAIESRSSSPVRLLRDRESCLSSIGGLYPGGEGAGYAGGIMSAAVDGVRLAEKAAERYLQMRK
ncbi:MAG: hypothetical protein IJO79_07445 [Firmicutes bacterium]|nr:hypothetical protein [Bacillota bacterium]